MKFSTSVIIFIITFMSLMYLFQNHMLFTSSFYTFPCRNYSSSYYGFRHPTEYTCFHTFRNRYIYVKDLVDDKRIIQLHLWEFIHNTNNDKRPSLLFFHGNNSNMIMNINKIVYFYTKLGCNIVCMDYQNYGKSTNTYNVLHENILRSNALDVYKDIVVQRYPTFLWYVYGISIGGIPALFLGRFPNIRGIIIENTLLSLKNVLLSPKYHKPFSLVHFFYRLLICHEIDTTQCIKSCRCPVLILSSKYDNIINYKRNNKEIYHLLKSNENNIPCYHRVFKHKKVRHTNAWKQEKSRSRYLDEFRRFFQRCSLIPVHKNSLMKTLA